MKAGWRPLIAAFLAGVLAGGAVGAFAQRRALKRSWLSAPDVGRAVKHLTATLSLDAGQQDAVRAAMEKRRAEMVSLRDDTTKKMLDIRGETRGEIEKVLRPEQAEKYARLCDRSDARLKGFLKKPE